MGQVSKDPSLALSEIVDLLSEYSKSNSRGNYVTLLDSLEHVTIKLKEQARQEQQREKKKHKQLQCNNHGPTNVSLQNSPNVPTWSCEAVSMDDIASLTLRSHSKPRILMSEISQKPSVSDQETVIVGRSSAPDSSSNVAAVPCEKFTTTTDVETSRTAFEIPIQDKLKQEIQRCEYEYLGKTFVVNGDERSETVNPDEISYFFSRFQQGEWLTNFNLMPLLFSFNWSKTTLVLHSSYASFKSSNQQSNLKVRWPLSRDHDRIIVPCCFQSHWTLFDVDLKRTVIRQYDSLAEDIPNSEVVLAIKERLVHAMAGWENQSQGFTAVNGPSRQQENDSDCGIYMVYNADCLASNRDTLEEQIDGARLRYRYLERLVDLERRGRSERQIVNMILPPNKKFRIKKRRVSEDISGDESGQNQEEPKKSRRLNWEPPSHLGPQDAWLEERHHLAAISSNYGQPGPEHLERAEDLLRMIEAVGCEEVMTAWDEAIAQEQRHIKLGTPKTDSTARAICQLIEGAQVRSFKDKVLLRIGKWIFTIKILQDVEIESERASSDQGTFKIEADDKGKKALTKAFAKFMREAHPELQEPSLAKERELQYCKYRRWWRDGQIWVYLYNAFGAAILLLIPGGQRTREGCAVYNEQFVKMKSGEREPFIKALQKLRPDLKKTVSKLDDHLEILKDDIADLLGRLQHPGISQKSKVEQCNGYQPIIKAQEANCCVTRPQPSTMPAGR